MSDELSFFLQSYERRGHRREVQAEIELVPRVRMVLKTNRPRNRRVP